MTMQYVPDLLKGVVDKVATSLGVPIYFDAGHYADVTKRLQLKDGAIEESTRTKYPLVWLVMDFEERFTRTDIYAEIPDAQIIIATSTQPYYSMDERRDITFVPVLYQIYAELIRQLSEPGGRFLAPLPIAHSKYDRPYWGGQESGNSQSNLFNDMIDAIQIKNLKLLVKKAKINC